MSIDFCCVRLWHILVEEDWEHVESVPNNLQSTKKWYFRRKNWYWFVFPKKSVWSANLVDQFSPRGETIFQLFFYHFVERKKLYDICRNQSGGPTKKCNESERNKKMTCFLLEKSASPENFYQIKWFWPVDRSYPNNTFCSAFHALSFGILRQNFCEYFSVQKNQVCFIFFFLQFFSRFRQCLKVQP